MIFCGNKLHVKMFAPLHIIFNKLFPVRPLFELS